MGAKHTSGSLALFEQREVRLRRREEEKKDNAMTKGEFKTEICWTRSTRKVTASNYDMDSQEIKTGIIELMNSCKQALQLTFHQRPDKKLYSVMIAADSEDPNASVKKLQDLKVLV